MYVCVHCACYMYVWSANHIEQEWGGANLFGHLSRQEQKPDIWVPSSKKVRAEKIQIFSDLKKIYSSLQIGKVENFYDPQKFSNPVISPLQLSTDFTT